MTDHHAFLRFLPTALRLSHVPSQSRFVQLETSDVHPGTPRRRNSRGVRLLAIEAILYHEVCVAVRLQGFEERRSEDGFD